jgi:hypothetical protein
MRETSQQQPKSSAPAGYRPLVPVDFTKGVGISVYAYVAAAAGIGLMVGLGIAITPGHPNAAAPRVSEALTTHTSGLSALPASYTGPSPSLLSTVDNSTKATAATPLFSQVNDKSAKKLASSHKKHGIGKLWSWTKGLGKHNAAKRPEYVSPNAPAADAEPTALQLATAAAATGPFVLGMQGDATVASYDVATGAIETYEGTSFVLDKTSAENGAISWQDFPFNVHYRCENNSCTIFRHGATASARLTR